MSHPKMSRPKPPPPGTEEASANLNLGEFQSVDTLTLSEAALVLNALVAKRRNDRKNVNETEYARPIPQPTSASNRLPSFITVG
jgi:DNA-directed RNA polymerase II subunit RPB4